MKRFLPIVSAALVLMLLTASGASATFAGQGNRIDITRADSGGYHAGVLNPKTKAVVLLGGSSSFEGHGLSPDGELIAFSSAAGALCTALSDFSDGGCYAVGPDYIAWPTYSPNGAKLAWNADGDLVTSPSTSNTPVLVPGLGAFTTILVPVWGAHTGNRIFFSGNMGDGIEVYSVKGDGTGLRNLTNTPTKSEYLGDVSPNGNTIVFGEYTGSGNPVQIVMRDASNGHHRKQLTHSADDLGWPSFTAEGKHIAYTRNYGDASSIFWMRLDGSRRRHLTPHVAGRYDTLAYVT